MSEIESRRVSFAVGAGILFLPLLCVWLLFRKGYSNTARFVGLSWTCVVTFGLLAQPGPDMRSIAQQARTQPVAGPAPTEAVAQTSQPASAKIPEAKSVLSQVFDATDHPKAKGARVKVRFPANWVAREGARPNSLRNFSGDYAGVKTVLALAIEEHEDQVESHCSKITTADWARQNEAPNWTVTSAKVFRQDGKHGALIDISQTQKVAEFTVHSRMQLALICHQRYVIKAICIASDSTPEAVASGMKKIAPLCKEYFRSVALT